MRFTGRLGLVDEVTPGFDVELEVERYRVVLRRCGELLGGWDLASCELWHETGREFRLKLHGEVFRFVADDPLKVVHGALPSFAEDVRPSRWRRRPRLQGVPRNRPAATHVRELLASGTVQQKAAEPSHQTRLRRARRRPAGGSGDYRTMTVDRAQIAYVDVGSGPTVVFLDGGIAGIELWRGVLSHVATKARCIALDLVGTGRSGPVPSGEQHSWSTHADYLDSLLDALDLGDEITLVVHGWGSLVGYAWASGNEDRLAGICNIESVLSPLSSPELQRWHARLALGGWTTGQIRSASGIVQIVAGMLAELTVDPLPAPLVEEILRPFEEDTESRASRSLLRSLPVAGGPTASVELAEQGWALLQRSRIPKLLVVGQPGFLVTDEQLAKALTLDNQTVATVVGRHFLPIESPDEVGRFVAMWVHQGR